MTKKYIDIPKYTTLNEIIEKQYTLSATQYKTFSIKNKTQLTVADFLDRDLQRGDLGREVGSEHYVDNSQYLFIKTKALQQETFLLDENKESLQSITRLSFSNMNLKKGDIIISKDSNVGEVAILDKDYSNAMLCGGIYKLPVTKNKYYLLAFIKSDIFRCQIDFLVPRGSTIRHGKTKFLECKIPIPNKNREQVMKYVELLTEAIINKEIAIKQKHKRILEEIHKELINNQDIKNKFSYSLPNIKEIMNLDRMDSCLYSEEFKKKEFIITNYINGTSTIYDLGFNISRGQNLQVSNIGKSIQTDKYKEGYYKLILPKYISKYGIVTTDSYLGNKNELKTLNIGDIIFGAEGNEKGRSLAIIEEQEMAITNIHGITLRQNGHDLTKGIFIKLFLDYLRDKGMIDSYAVGGNGGSLAIKYWNFLRFPNFDEKKEKEIVKLYHNPDVNYAISKCTLDNFLEYDIKFNEIAGIYELDKTLKYLRKKLNNVLDNIADDKDIKIEF
ncbi:TPA: restriction endonuclease subunit S [Clostridioides difficile]|uniref:restriction endonuclease subunit S n=1 Tax=Clostridioides difficile TaxID=1496 RepID=UPI000944A47E|nr:restriction endonuclease subunit S [Clostridioides difficile]MBJ9769938.1 restriction endonuclease subunit S [Clostridioides difficile]MDV9805232.1 restriction endonuclease subunit S [Clostridioides difficile]MDV9896269.1 restriction endonuclease subunit S [Clostridioides difficile]MDV9911317.1 restriction endonuclease subunit S [Clostridioides difficile]VFE46379.1 Type I restriction modification DNA specificity domain [Clostridioides difficile]